MKILACFMLLLIVSCGINGKEINTCLKVCENKDGIEVMISNMDFSSDCFCNDGAKYMIKDDGSIVK